MPRELRNQLHRPFFAAVEWAKAQFGDEDLGRYHGPAHLSALRDLSIKRIKRGA